MTHRYFHDESQLSVCVMLVGIQSMYICIFQWSSNTFQGGDVAVGGTEEFQSFKGLFV